MSFVIIIISNSALSPASVGCFVYGWYHLVHGWHSSNCLPQQPPTANIISVWVVFQKLLPHPCLKLFCFDLVQPTTAIESGYIHQPYHVQKTVFHNSLPCLLALTMRCSLSIGWGGLIQMIQWWLSTQNYSTFCKEFPCLKRIFDQYFAQYLHTWMKLVIRLVYSNLNFHEFIGLICQ